MSNQLDACPTGEEIADPREHIPPPEDRDAPGELQNAPLSPAAKAEEPDLPPATAPATAEALRVDRLWPDFAAELAARADGGCPSVATGLDGLDGLLGGGLPPGQVTLLCGSPGVGKTSVALAWAVLHALAKGRAVVWSLELPSLLALARLVSQKTGAPWARVLAGGCPDEVAATFGELAGLPLYLVDRPGDEGFAAINALLPPGEAGDRPPLLVIDYTQLLAASRGDQRAEVEGVSAWLVEVAKATGAAVLAISSTSRGAYSIGAGGKVEMDRVLAMARDSGRLEFDAAVVLGLVALRAQGAEDVPERFSKGWLVAAKNRLGQRGRVPVEVDGQAGTIREISPEDVAPAFRGLSDGDLEAEVLQVVARSTAQGEPLTSMNAICNLVTARRERVQAAVKRLLHPDNGRLTGGNRKPFRVLPDAESTTEGEP